MQEVELLHNPIKMANTKTFATLDEALAFIKEQQGLLETANKNIKALEKERDDALAEVAALSAKLDLSEKHGSEGLIVTIGKKNFTLLGNRFFTPEGEMDAETLSKNTKELERMLKIKSGSLIPLD